jgi:hypothetical protein
MSACPLWSDGVHCFMQKWRTTIEGFIPVPGPLPVKVCACGESVSMRSDEEVTPVVETTGGEGRA